MRETVSFVSKLNAVDRILNKIAFDDFCLEPAFFIAFQSPPKIED